MQLTHLIYASRPFGYDDLTLTGILAAATRNNARLDVTGALICRDDVFLQWLEGPEASVSNIFSRIEKDNAHTDLQVLSMGPIEARLFPDWAMRHDPAQSWMWSPAEVRAGAVSKATANEAQAVFLRLSRSAPSEPQRCPFHRA
jgi:hypothetical protein